MEPYIIAIAVVVALSASIAAVRFPRGRGFFVFSALDLFSVAVYETYMLAVWEKHVHAPIRLDFFVVDLPLLVLGLTGGFVGLFIARRSRPSHRT